MSAQSTSTITVPDTVQDVIAARIDRLGDVQKRTVQTASVIGREFALELLRRVSEAQEQLERALSDLKRIELIYEKSRAGDSAYVFRHALTQDVAYASLLQSERKRLHARIGHAIEDIYAERLEEHTEELVYHFARGEVWDRVARYARDAGDRAATLCVDDKAVEFYDIAIDALARVPETPDTARAAVDARLAMRAPLWRGGQPDRLFALFKEAEAIATRHGDTGRLDTVYAFFVQYHWAKGEHDRALDYGDRCLARAEATGDMALRVTGLFYRCHAYQSVGRFAECVREGRALLALLADRTHERFGLSGLPFSGVCALIAHALVELGDITGALDYIRRGREVADTANHAYSQTALAAYEGEVLLCAGRVDEAVATLEATEKTCREKRFLGQLVNARKYLGHAYVAAGRPHDAIRAAEESLALQERARVYVNRTIQHLAVAHAAVALGDLDRADAEVRAAMDTAEQHGERGDEGWARLAAARLAWRRGDPAAEGPMLEQAEEIAEELGMLRLLEECRALARSMR